METDLPLPLGKVKKIFKRFDTKKIHDPPDFMPVVNRVAIGTIAGMVATVLVHPLDLIKTRKLVDPTPHTVRSMARQIVLTQGVMTLYTGLSAGLLRQGTYTSTRLAVYNALYDNSNEKNTTTPTEEQKVMIGLVAGLAGGFVGNPSEVVLVRMMGASAPRAANGDRDLQYLIHNRYKNCFDGIVRVIEEEGVRTLWRGGTLTLGRSIFLTVASIGSYSAIRDKLVKIKIFEGYHLHILTTLVTSFVTTILSLPIDVVKTRYQIKRSGVTIPEIFIDIWERRGFFGFWSRRIFIPYYCRIVVHTMTSFYVSENLIHKYRLLDKT